MRALLLERPLQFSYAELPVPEPAPDEVLVRVHACGICGSDIHGIDGSSGRRIPPLVMGHEAAGVVAALGRDVADWSEGERVTFDSTLTCGACGACTEGRSNLCERRRVLGAATDEHRKEGAFAEYVTLPARALVRLPDGLPFERAAFAEPLAVALHAVKLSGLVPGQSAVVVGTGVIGLLVVQVLRTAGVNEVIGIDLDSGRLDLARRLGASATFPADTPDLARAVRDATGGQGADAALEAVGVTSAIRTAIGSVRRGGRVVLIGNVAPSVDIPLQAVVTGELTLLGSCASSGELAESVELLAAGRVDVEPLTSVVAPLQEGGAWFERLYRAEPGLMKVILTPPAP